jgi:type VI secretion system secreted protein VgrG
MSNVDLALPSVPKHGLTVRRFDVVEGLSMPFEVALTAMSPEQDLDFEQIVGAEAAVRIDRGRLGARTWTGVVSRIEQTGVEPGGLAAYALRVVPRFWLLSQRSDNRIFQHATALEIVLAVLAGHGVAVDARVDPASVPKLEVRVQYGETDLAFVSRLCEEAGISYFFEDHEGASRLVLTDRPEAVPARAAGPLPFTTTSSHDDRPYVSGVAVAVETRPGRVTIADFDLRRPRYALVYRAEDVGTGEGALERCTYEPGAAIVDLPPSAARSTDTPAADDQSRARADEHQGYALAGKALGSIRADRRRVSFHTNVMDLSPGTAFVMEGAPRPELGHDQRLLVVEAHYDGEIDGEWVVRGAAAFAGAPLRPAQKTPRPRIDGVQSAIVTGPPGAEIHTDEFGRVRVRFHWDREGDAFDDHHSAWLRVDEGWAGAGFGAIATPRVGQEVLVGFYDGNPDQPIVVGRVYGATHPAPHGLPGSATLSTWRSRSSPASQGFHEITFDDARGRELVFVQSERDLEKNVLREEVETTGRDRKAVVGKHRGATIAVEDTIVAGKMHEAGLAKMGDLHILDQGQPVVAALPTRHEIIAKRITISTGGAMIVLDGPDITVTGQSNVVIEAGHVVDVQGRPYVHINPPLVTREASAEKAPPPPDRLVAFQLVSEEGLPVSGARVHVTREGGGDPEPQVTNGDGLVRLPVGADGTHTITLGRPPANAGDAPAVEVGKTPAQAVPLAKPTKHRVPISIAIVLPEPGKKLVIDPGDYPKTLPFMPTIPLEARVLVQGKPTSLGFVRWEFHVSGSYRVRDASGSSYRMQAYKLAAGTTRTKPNEKTSFTLAPAEIVGGQLEIKATFHGEADLGGVTVTKVVEGWTIAGKNPPRASVEQCIVEKAGDLAWVYLRMFCHESLHKLAQFQTSGDVLYGAPSGVGIVQRDPEAQEWAWPRARLTTPNNFFPRIFWDWVKNVEEGIRSFESTYVGRGRADLDALRRKHARLPEYSDGVLMRAAIRRYNGGTEYAGADDGARYVVAPAHTDNVPYVSDVLGDAHGTAPGYPVPADALARTWPAPPPPPPKKPHGR